MNYLFLTLFIFIALFNISSNGFFNNKLLANMSKPLIIPFLLLFYISSQSSSENLLILALLMAWLGDIIIVFYHEYKDKTYLPIYGGLSAFLIGHVLYIILFIQNSHQVPYFLLPIYVLIGSFIGLKLFKSGIFLAKNRHTVLKIFIILYSMVIMTMSLYAYNNILTYVGSLCFLASDTLLSYKEFAHKKIPEATVMTTYIAAQVFIVLGFVL